LTISGALHTFVETSSVPSVPQPPPKLPPKPGGIPGSTAVLERTDCRRHEMTLTGVTRDLPFKVVGG
jgi:hypothetical protein